MQSRRDVGNEVIVALAVIGMLALALTFGVVLTLTRTVPPETTTPGTSAATVATTAAATTNAPANTAVAVNTQIATATSSTFATDTKVANDVATMIQLTLSPVTLSPTATAISATYPPRKTSTPSKVAVLPTVLPTATPTITTVPPTYPPRKTHVPDTVTPLPTATTIPPTYPPRKTHTRTPLPSVTPDVSSTPTRIIDAGILPTPTPTITPTVLATITPTALPTIAIATSCAPRTDWVLYVVQPGDTLFSIAVQAKITLAALQQANCISNPNAIFYGRVIVVPPGTIIATVTPGAATPASGAGNAALCPNPDVRITSPISGSSFSGILTIAGTARAANFANYQLEFLPEGTSTWVRTGYSTTQVTNGLLGRLDPNPSQLPLGNYSLRLRIETTDNKIIAPCVIQIKLVK